MMLKEIADYLQANNVGPQVFYGVLPDGPPDEAVCVYEYAGSQPEFLLVGQQMFDTPGLQAVVRGVTYASARNKMQQVYDLLAGKIDIVLGITRYYSIMPVQSPFPIGTDSHDRFRLAVNFMISREGGL